MAGSERRACANEYATIAARPQKAICASGLTFIWGDLQGRRCIQMSRGPCLISASHPDLSGRPRAAGLVSVGREMGWGEGGRLD